MLLKNKRFDFIFTGMTTYPQAVEEEISKAYQLKTTIPAYLYFVGSNLAYVSVYEPKRDMEGK